MTIVKPSLQVDIAETPPPGGVLPASTAVGDLLQGDGSGTWISSGAAPVVGNIAVFLTGDRWRADSRNTVGVDYGSGSIRNLRLFAASGVNYQGGDGIAFLGNAVTEPTADPAAGVFAYAFGAGYRVRLGATGFYGIFGAGLGNLPGAGTVRLANGATVFGLGSSLNLRYLSTSGNSIVLGSTSSSENAGLICQVASGANYQVQCAGVLTLGFVSTSGRELGGLFGLPTGASIPTGDGVLQFFNSTTNPSSDPVGGPAYYASAGAAIVRGTGGTVTTIAPA